MNIEDFGFETVKHPIVKIRVKFYAGSWYVEYQRKPKFFFDQWWWFDDSIYKEYKDAYVRAQVLASEGAICKIKHKQIEINVKDFANESEIDIIQ